MQFWKEHDYEDDPVSCSGIMTKIGKGFSDFEIFNDDLENYLVKQK